MAVALTTRSWVSLSFPVSDVREDVLLSDVALQPLCGFLKRTIRPFLGFTARLIELLNRVRRRFRWREELGASEESGRCPQLSSVCCLRRPQELSFSLSVSPGPSLLLSSCFCFSGSSMAPLRSCSRSPFFRQSKPSSESHP